MATRRAKDTPIEVTDSEFESIFYAILHGDVRVKNFRQSIHLASDQEVVKSIKRRLKAGADLQARDDRNWTLLHWAAFRDLPKTIRFLINQGIDFEAISSGTEMNALHFALVENSLKIR